VCVDRYMEKGGFNVMCVYMYIGAAECQCEYFMKVMQTLVLLQEL